MSLQVADSAPVRVSPGNQTSLKVPRGISRIAIGDEGVADVRVVSPTELLVLGKKLGKTNLTLWVNGVATSRQVLVDDGRADELGQLIREMVNPTLRTRTFNGTVVVDGQVDSTEELQRLYTLVGEDRNVKLLVRVDPSVLPFIAQQITQALARSGMREARATAVGSRIVLEGSVQEEADRHRAQLIAESFYSHLHGG